MIFPELFPDCETEHLAQIFAENRIAEKLFELVIWQKEGGHRHKDRQDRHAEYLDRQEFLKAGRIIAGTQTGNPKGRQNMSSLVKK